MHKTTNSCRLALVAFILVVSSSICASLAQTAAVTIAPKALTTTAIIKVPPGATCYQVQVIDKDVFRDDVLTKCRWKAVPLDDDGNPVKEIVISAVLVCVGGEVCGDSNSSGEGTAEVFLEVAWNDGSNPTITAPVLLSCP